PLKPAQSRPPPGSTTTDALRTQLPSLPDNDTHTFALVTAEPPRPGPEEDGAAVAVVVDPVVVVDAGAVGVVVVGGDVFVGLELVVIAVVDVVVGIVPVVVLLATVIGVVVD